MDDLFQDVKLSSLSLSSIPPFLASLVYFFLFHPRKARRKTFLYFMHSASYPNLFSKYYSFLRVVMPTEETWLLPHGAGRLNDEAPGSRSERYTSREESSGRGQIHAVWFFPMGGLCILTIVVLSAGYMYSPFSRTVGYSQESLVGWSMSGTEENSVKEAYESAGNDSTLNQTFSYGNSTNTPDVGPRCEWVVKQFQKREHGNSFAQLKHRYQTQSEDANVFFRATAHIFWNDFVNGKWGYGLTKSLREDATLHGGAPLDHRSTYTWVTGDQHLSNFGAFQNRHGDVVFSVNDFDEGAIYDFQVDVLRIAVSVYNHALTNGLESKEVKEVLEEFTDSYVKTVLGYIENEDALLFELTSKTTTGFLKQFLKDVRSDRSYKKQMKKYTKVDEQGLRSFQKGPIGEPDPDTKLAALPPEREEQIRSAFASTKYGATMMKLGWSVREWDDDFFTVLDVGARIGSGVGSWGVDRFYVLLKGTDSSFENTNLDGKDMAGTAVVLDVKYEPPGAITEVLTPEEAAWYQVMFPNDAARAVEAQRKLTSYTDPYTGWILLPDENNVTLPFAIRQRSPWKDSPDLDKLTDPGEFSEFISQIAAATATSHVRGSVGKKPGDFKSVVSALLGSKKKRRQWGEEVADLAKAYHEQVLLDFQCFSTDVAEHYS